jgi:hypothetical protein
LVEPTSNNGMDTCLQMHFLVHGNSMKNWNAVVLFLFRCCYLTWHLLDIR